MPEEAIARISYPDSKAFQGMVEALSKIIDEVSMKLGSEGARIRALDPAKIALIDIRLPPSAFLEYSVEEEASIGFNVSSLLKLLKRGKRGDRLEIEARGDRVTITITGDVVRRYTILNLDVVEPEIPEARFSFNVSATLLADLVKNAIRDAEAVGDTVEFEAPNDSELYIKGVGPEGSGAVTKLTAETGQLIEYSVSEHSRARYSIDYLKHVLSLTKVADLATVEFSTDAPLRLGFSLPGEGRVEYLLAPKLE